MGYWLGGLCVALWALIPVVAKLGQARLDSHQFLFYSSLISFVTLWVIGLLKGQARWIVDYRLNDWFSAIVLGLMGTYIYYLLLYQGYAVGNGVEVLIVQYTWPVMISLLSPWLLKERFGWPKALGLSLGFLAIILMVTQGQFTRVSLDNPIALLWVGFGSLCFALFSIFSKRVALEPIGLSTCFFLVATVASALGVTAFSSWQWPSAEGLISLFINGVLVNGVSYLFWLGALKRVEASRLAPLIFVTPIFSAIYLWLGFNEPFPNVYFLSLGLIVLAGLATTLKLTRT